MHVEERLAAEGHGWLVGYDYAEQRSARLPEELRERLERAAAAGA
jgi:acyl-CoA thioesterase FadM